MSLEQCIEQISQLTDRCCRIEEAITSLGTFMEKQSVTMDHLLAAILEMKEQLPDQAYFNQSLLSISSMINQLMVGSSELSAKLGYLAEMVGSVTSTLGAAPAFIEVPAFTQVQAFTPAPTFIQAHGGPPQGPIPATLESHGARPTDPSTFDIPGHVKAAGAEKKMRTAQTVTGENLSQLPLDPTRFIQVLTSHLTGHCTVFHELVSAIAKVSRDSRDLQVAMDEFNRVRTSGASAHAAIISITQRCEYFRNCEAPKIQVTSKSQIPKACHGSLRVVPEGPKLLGQGWIYIYLTPKGTFGLKI